MEALFIMCSNRLKYHLNVIGVLMLLIAIPQGVQADQCDELNETQLGKTTCAAVGTRSSDLVPPSTAIREHGKVGQAIIVVAAEKDRNALLFDSNRLAAQMYKLLELRGFTHDDIHYMNPHPPDPDDDGYLNEELQDYNLKEPESELTEAFVLAASRLKPGQQFVFYLHGDAQPNYFQIKEDYSLEAQYFRALLDKIPDGVQQVIILDTCYSGSFVDDLQGGKNRIVVTSNDDKTDS
ncbi:secreted protein [Beggiatoa sp. SS]|nr:secreted protein [Beggiatoa sp. SS]